MSATDTGEGTEITPAMIDAGTTVLRDHYIGDGVYDLREETIAALYRSMYLLRR